MGSLVDVLKVVGKIVETVVDIVPGGWVGKLVTAGIDVLENIAGHATTVTQTPVGTDLISRIIAAIGLAEAAGEKHNLSKVEWAGIPAKFVIAAFALLRDASPAVVQADTSKLLDIMAAVIEVGQELDKAA